VFCFWMVVDKRRAVPSLSDAATVKQ